MSIPSFEEFLLPLLRLSSDGNEHRLKEAYSYLADEFKLDETQRSELLPSGQSLVYQNRIGWARFFLKKAGLLDSPRRGIFIITKRGVSVLEENPPELNISYLKRFPEFKDLYSNKKEDENILQKSDPRTPLEVLETSYDQLRSELSAELLQQLKTVDYSFFEKIVVDLLVKMGYGGNRAEAGKAVGRSGDEGIDGIIKEDHLGLDNIYVQAKRWSGNVGSPEIRNFIGSLAVKGSTKGVMITTSDFSTSAREQAQAAGVKLILIDGRELARLMIDFGVGVSTTATFEIKQIDSDYFEE
jgi:restriction system protein